mmetsp:Transcript_31441/g.56293  ORF Transcript_31441/g.56293 Transcript_31441/m.56293 type:complete len:375 (-) Transcript_31441:36-1160(-)
MTPAGKAEDTEGLTLHASEPVARSSIHSMNEGVFRPKGKWQKKLGKTDKPGNDTLKSSPLTSPPPQQSASNTKGKSSHTTPRSSGSSKPSPTHHKPEVLTLIGREHGATPEPSPGQMQYATKEWGFDTLESDPALLRSSMPGGFSGRDQSSRYSRGSRQKTSRASGLRHSVPPKPVHGAALAPIQGSDFNARVEAAKEKATGITQLPSLQERAALQPIHYTPQVQAIDRFERAGDLLTLSPSEAQERIKSGRHRMVSGRKSSLSRGVIFGDLTKHAELEHVLGPPSRGNDMHHGLGFSGLGNGFEQPRSRSTSRQVNWPHHSGDSWGVDGSGGDGLSSKMTRMTKQAQQVQDQQLARQAEIMRQIDTGVPGKYL